MQRSEMRAAVAAREDGLRHVRKLTVRVGAAGLACSGIIAIALGHLSGAAASGTGASSSNNGNSSTGNSSSGTSGARSGTQYGSQGGYQQGAPAQGSSGQGSSGQGSGQQATTKQRPLQAPAQNLSPTQGTAQGVSGGS